MLFYQVSKKVKKEGTCLPGNDVSRCSTQSGQGFLPTLQKLLHLAGDAGRRGGHGESALGSTPHTDAGEDPGKVATIGLDLSRCSSGL